MAAPGWLGTDCLARRVVERPGPAARQTDLLPLQYVTLAEQCVPSKPFLADIIGAPAPGGLVTLRHQQTYHSELNHVQAVRS